MEQSIAESISEVSLQNTRAPAPIVATVVGQLQWFGVLKQGGKPAVREELGSAAARGKF
jgi:hypothetical protein